MRNVFFENSDAMRKSDIILYSKRVRDELSASDSRFEGRLSVRTFVWRKYLIER